MNSIDLLQPIDKKTVADLRARHPDLPEELCDAVLDLIARAKILFIKVVSTPDGDIFQGQLALMGMLNRTYELLLGSIQQIEQGNGHVWSACFRGLIETFGAVVYVGERPNSLPSLLERGIPAGKLRAAADRGSPGLGKDIDRLNNIVHPGDRSLYAGFTVRSEPDREAIFVMGVKDFAPDEVEEGVVATVNICALILRKMDKLLDSNPKLLHTGKLIMRRLKE